MDNEQKAKIFKALCDEKRLSIIDFLKTGDKCACDIIEHFDLKQSAISYHMKILTNSGIVESWNIGKWTHYKISANGCTILLDTVKNIIEI